jgi:hypothetical protein
MEGRLSSDIILQDWFRKMRENQRLAVNFCALALMSQRSNSFKGRTVTCQLATAHREH